MDLLPAETPSIAQKHRFRSLKLASVSMDEPLPETPVGVDYGVLENGLTYYVRSNAKPRMRAALAFAVKDQDEARSYVRSSLAPLTMKAALGRILPSPCKKQYTVVVLMPQLSRLKLLLSFCSLKLNGFSQDTKFLVGVAGALVLTTSLWRYWNKVGR